MPSTYFAMPVNDQISVGLGINAPFGLKTQYDSDWMGRFRAIKSDIKTININPSISYQASDTISLGFGVSAQRRRHVQRCHPNASGALCSRSVLLVCPGFVSNLDGFAEVKGDDWGWGYNLGVIFQPSPQARVGLSYRSSIKYTVTGDASFDLPTVTTLGPNNAAANAALACYLLQRWESRRTSKCPTPQS